MITALAIRNFKCLRETGKLSVRPLTFLVGPNSSGKSSIIQSLLLLRQTVESRDLKNPLNINGPYVRLGSYPDLLFMRDYKAQGGEGPTDRWDAQYVRRAGDQMFVTVKPNTILEFR